jgi:hypothetical protein
MNSALVRYNHRETFLGDKNCIMSTAIHNDNNKMSERIKEVELRDFF